MNGAAQALNAFYPYITELFLLDFVVTQFALRWSFSRSKPSSP